MATAVAPPPQPAPSSSTTLANLRSRSARARRLQTPPPPPPRPGSASSSRLFATSSSAPLSANNIDFSAVFDNTTPAFGPYTTGLTLNEELNALPSGISSAAAAVLTSPSSSRSSTASSVNTTASLGPLEANVENVHIDPKVIFPDAYAHIVDVKTKIARVTQSIESLRPELKAAIAAAQKLGTLNVGDKSFRGRNNPLVYVAHNSNVNDFVVRGDFTVEGRPFRVINENSFNSVLAQMKDKRKAASAAIKTLAQAQDKVKSSEELLASLRKNLDSSTKKLRSNMRNYTAKKAKTMMRGLKPTTKVVPSANVKTAQALLQPKKTLWQRMTGRGRKAGSTRRTRRS